MLQQDEALEKILAHIRPLSSHRVALSDALDCFAAENISARLALPPFDNSAMDGYAVVASSAARGARLKLVAEQPAGVDRGHVVKAGEAIRIFTGAPLPAGADAVVMQEEVVLQGSEIVLQADLQTGDFVRRRGGDVAAGQQILAAGDRITPQVIALLAAQGVDALNVGGRVRAAVVSTGDELVAPGTDLKAGEIYDSNSALLAALLKKTGVQIGSVVHCRDNAGQIEAAVRAGTRCDVLILTGGVSVGARDFVKEAIVAAGGTLDLWRVAVKPGKPFLFGRAGSCAIFGLPGNPVSAFVTFLLFVRPAILRLMGARDNALRLPSVSAHLDESVSNPSERAHYIRGVLSGGAFRLSGRQESHALFGLSRSNALLLVRGHETLPAGAMATVFLWE